MTRDAARALGYTVVSDDHYEKSKGSQFPPRPAKLESPTDKSRNEGLGTFDFRQFPLANRRDPDEIVILGSCDGMIDDWQKNNIVEIDIPQLRFAKGFTGRLICHRLVAPKVKCLFSRWEELDLLHLLRSFDDMFIPRYKRGKSPSSTGHDIKQSINVDSLSNHAFGSAMDINADDNPFNSEPARCPMHGCVRELVPSANEIGFFWGATSVLLRMACISSLPISTACEAPPVLKLPVSSSACDDAQQSH